MFIDLDAIKPKTLDFPLDGNTYSIPMIDALPAEIALDLVESGTVDRGEMVKLFRSILEKHAPGALERLTLEQLMALLEAWQQTGTVGESSPSSD